MISRKFCLGSHFYKIHLPSDWKAITNLTLNSHKLLIKRGKWLNILHKDKLCTLCSKLENEFHVICEYPRYDTCRKLYIRRYYFRKPSMKKKTDSISKFWA